LVEVCETDRTTPKRLSRQGLSICLRGATIDGPFGLAMSSFRASDPPASDNPESEGFAATVVEELHPDQADLIEIDGQAMAEVQIESLPTIGHVGRYVLKHQLGVGGLGTVYAAIDPLLSRPIAVKTLKLDAVEPSQREALEQVLLTEARAAAGLSLRRRPGRPRRVRGDGAPARQRLAPVAGLRLAT
jgi:hypothetical protein